MSDAQLIEGTDIRRAYLKVSFEPEALRDHFDGWDNDADARIQDLSDAELAEAALRLIESDPFWDRFARDLRDVVDYAHEQRKVTA